MNIDNYPELATYVSKLRELTDTLFRDRSMVTVDMIASVAEAAGNVKVTEILDKCAVDVLIDNAETTEQWFNNIHQAENALTLCKLVESLELVKVDSDDKDRWVTPKIEAVN